jgi:hypothetical protein
MRDQPSQPPVVFSDSRGTQPARDRSRGPGGQQSNQPRVVFSDQRGAHPTAEFTTNDIPRTRAGSTISENSALYKTPLSSEIVAPSRLPGEYKFRQRKCFACMRQKVDENGFFKTYSGSDKKFAIPHLINLYKRLSDRTLLRLASVFEKQDSLILSIKSSLQGVYLDELGVPKVEVLAMFSDKDRSKFEYYVQRHYLQSLVEIKMARTSGRSIDGRYIQHMNGLDAFLTQAGIPGNQIVDIKP